MSCIRHILSTCSHEDCELDARFPNMEIIATTDLYFDGTWEYAVVACSFAAYGGSQEATIAKIVSGGCPVKLKSPACIVMEIYYHIYTKAYLSGKWYDQMEEKYTVAYVCIGRPCPQGWKY